MDKLSDFIGGIFKSITNDVLLYLFVGTIVAAFVFEIVLMNVKKRALPVGRTMLLTTLTADFFFVALGMFKKGGIDLESKFFLAIVCVTFLGAVLAIAGGIVSTAVFTEKKDRCCHGGKPTKDNVGEIVSSPQIAPQAPAKAAPVSTEIDRLLSKITDIYANGGSIDEMREAATLLQTERAKPENKEDYEVYGRLNKGLIDLLAAIQKR